MSVSVQLSISATVSGSGITESYTPPGFPFTNAQSLGAGPIPTPLAASTENTIDVPNGGPYQYALIVPPTSSANAKILKGASGDTGLTFQKNIALISLESVSSFIIESTSAEVVGILWV